MTNRAPRSHDEDLVDAPSPEHATPELLTPSLVESAAVADSLASASSSGPLPAEETSREPEPAGASSRELTAPELTAEELDSLEGVALSPLREPAPPPSESEDVTSDQLLPDDEAPPVPIESAPSGPYEPPEPRQPWVDQVSDPVTPYEQHVSETIKVADLPPVEQLRGRVLANRYLAEELAEQTAISLSYRAYHLALDRAVTVRILPRGLACSDEACQEVRRVARAASELENPHIAGALDFGVTSDGWPFLVTEHYQGRSLAVLLAEEGKFVLRRVLHIGKQLAGALAAAHQTGIVHGLLSPDNVMVVEPGTSAEVALIVGFGVHSARGPVPAPPRSGVFAVPFYVSPEQASCRPLDARSDIYSLGVLLYELMTGVPPFSDGDFAAVLCQHLDDDPEPPSKRLPSPGALAKALDAVVERCLRKEPDQRYQSAAEIVDDLTRLEAAAARNKRRPMPEIARPTTMIHSPPPRADSSHASQGAKVIVHGEEDGFDAPDSSEGRGSSPGSTPVAPPAAARAAVTAPPRSVVSGGVSSGGAASGDVALGGVKSGSATSGRRPMRVSVDQATIKISAIDRELAMALHSRKAAAKQVAAARRGVMAALLANLMLLMQWFVRLFGGGKSTRPHDDSRDS